MKKQETEDPEFKPPKFPASWLLYCLLTAPATTILTYILSSDGMTLLASVCIGLALLAIFLSAIVFQLHHSRYDEAFQRQLMKIEIENLKNQVETLKAHMKKNLETDI